MVNVINNVPTFQRIHACFGIKVLVVEYIPDHHRHWNHICSLYFWTKLNYLLQKFWCKSTVFMNVLSPDIDVIVVSLVLRHYLIYGLPCTCSSKYLSAEKIIKCPYYRCGLVKLMVPVALFLCIHLVLWVLFQSVFFF